MVGLISGFERNGATWNGDFGVAPSAICDYFKSRGFETVMAKDNNAEIIDNIGENYDAVIVTAYNNKDNIMDMVHTVCLDRTNEGEYMIHNGYRVKPETGMRRLSDAVLQIGKNPAVISIIGIRRAGK